MPRVLVAADKFKGSLTGMEVLAAIGEGMRAAVPGLDISGTLIADGGDGTLDAAESCGFTRVPVTASGPLGDPVETSYAVRGAQAVVEMADACGLVRAGGRLDALNASSRGFGEVIRAALDAGVRDLVLGIGGSASTDGGAGMLQALGARLVDDAGQDLPPGGGALARLASVDLSGLHPGLADSTITLASDVNNPLLGEQGCVAIFSPQKGADEAMRIELEAAVTHYSTLVTTATGRDDTALPGAGAAGGVGYAAMAVLGARMRPGIEVVLGLSEFPALLADADLVVTGEGALDLQTLLGKAPAGVARAARAAGVPVVAICGVALLSPEEVASTGIDAIYQLVDLEPDRDVCMRDADRLLRDLSGRVAAERFADS